MIRKIEYNVRWFVPSVLLLLFFVQTALSEGLPTVNNVFESLIQAVEQDDNEAYCVARSAALELDERQFDALLNVLEKVETWQALAIQGGLRVRRQNPELATQFDKHLDWLRNNTAPARMGPIFHWRDERNMFASSEGDWLRYEAILTEKADLPMDAMGIPGWIAFRRAVFSGGALHADDMKFRIIMLRDVPGWIPYGHILGRLPTSIRRSSDKVDTYVPELVEHYKQIRQEMTNDSTAPVSIEPRPTISTFYRLIEAIAEADTDVAIPALNQIRKFEQTTGTEIQSRLKAQGVKPWRNPRVEKIFEKLDGLIEKRQKTADNQ